MRMMDGVGSDRIGRYIPFSLYGNYGSHKAETDKLHLAGKTGTSQNPQGIDHSVFFAFAPVDDPQIALAVFIENAGGGGTWAAPTAGLMIEKYLRGEISNKYKEKKAWSQ